MRHIAVKEAESLPVLFDVFSSNVQPDRTLIAKGLYPPLPLNTGNLVWGKKIIRAAQAIGLENISVQDVSGSPAELLALALRLENRIDEYSWPELEKILEACKTYDISADDSSLQLLISKKGSFVPLAEKYTALPVTLKKLLEQKRIDLKIAYRVRELPEHVLNKILQNESAFSFSEIRLFLTNLYEVWRRDSLESKRLAEIVENACESKQPNAYLYKLRFPELSSMEERFNELREKHIKGSGIVLEAPRFFEGSSYSVRFLFSTPQELSKKVDSLERIESIAEELFDLLR